MLENNFLIDTTTAATDSCKVEITFPYLKASGQTKEITIAFILSCELIQEAERIDDKIKSLTTTEMGLDQGTIADQIQAAIFAGETDKARDLMQQIEQKGSFYNQEWKVYHTLLKPHAAVFIDRLFEGIKAIALQEKLSQADFMLFIISFVQNITYDGLPGIASPVTVIANQCGACAAKSYLLFLLLKKLGTDCVVLGSQDYNHILLGINTKTAGVHKVIGGKKYYLLETTYPDWKIGAVNAEWSDMHCWEQIDIN